LTGVLRRITDFRTDESGDWISDLDCGHSRHVRHEPPLADRAWVLDANEREGRLGSLLECGRCAQRELPADFAPYRRTPSFDSESVPNALRQRHSTKAGVWAHIHIESGQLRLQTFEPFDDEETLNPDSPGLVLPEIEHAVTPIGSVRFHVEFMRRAGI
jgi:tellurite methyltransferase